MAVDPILGWTLIAESEDQPYVRANEIGLRITLATQQDINIVTTAGGTIVVTSTQFEENVHFDLTGSPGGGFTLEVPDGDRNYVVENNSGQIATVDTVSGAGSPVAIADSAIVHLQNKGTDIVKTADVGSGTGQLQADGSVAATGDFNWDDNDIAKLNLKDYSEEKTAPVSSSATIVLDIENGNVFEIVLFEDITTVTLSNPSVSGTSCSITLILEQDPTSGWTITWPASVDWAGGIAPTLSVGANDVDIVVLMTIDAGTRWYGTLVGNDFS